jgi:serine/threonine protein kinase
MVRAGMEKCPFALVLEFYPHGSLYDVLVAKRLELPFHILVRMARDIALGILHLHKEKVIHRDIATRNVLVGDNYCTAMPSSSLFFVLLRSSSISETSILTLVHQYQRFTLATLGWPGRKRTRSIAPPRTTAPSRWAVTSS